MKKSLVSIIIPVYNVEPYLHQCLDSVINQTYKNLEIILIDDGSTDKSGVICDEYKAKDKRIIVIHQKNQGLSAARNAGLDICKGEYISFIDSDDYVDLRFVEILLLDIVKNCCEISSCAISRFSDLSTPMVPTFIYPDEKLSATQYLQRNIVVVWNKLYSSKMFAELRFLTGKFGEDNFIYFPLISKANFVYNESKLLYCYRMNNTTSITKTCSNKYCLDVLEAKKSCVKFIIFNNYSYMNFYAWFIDYFNWYKFCKKTFKNRKESSLKKVIKKDFIEFVKKNHLRIKWLSYTIKSHPRVKAVLKILLFPVLKLRSHK